MNQKMERSTKKSNLGELVAITADDYMLFYHFEDETRYVELDETDIGKQYKSERVPVITRFVDSLHIDGDELLWINDKWSDEIVLNNI
jgi:hypothetical protein